MGHNGCDGSQASGPWAIGSGYRFKTLQFHFGTNLSTKTPPIIVVQTVRCTLSS